MPNRNVGDDAGKASLLDAIWAERDADEPRRVYADWLQQRGDPRGEFIALQLEVAHGEASAAAVRRTKALLSTHRKEWLGPELMVGLVNQRFERGFLVGAKVKLDAQFRDPATLGSEELWFLRDLDGNSGALDLAPAMRSLEYIRLASEETLRAAIARTEPRSWRIVETGPELSTPDVHALAVASPAFRKVPELRVWVWPESLGRLVQLARERGWPNPTETARLQLTRGAGFPADTAELRAFLLAAGAAELAAEVTTHTTHGGDLVL